MITKAQCGADLFFSAGFEKLECQPLHRRRFPHGSDHAFGACIVWVDEQGDELDPWHELGQQFEPLRHQPPGEKADPGEVAARPGETGDQGS